ncbi:MAG: metal-dependent transcriptional regulator [Thermoplasmata archaeon]
MSEKKEEYLEAMYRLTDGKKPIKTTEIANYLKVAPPSVTEMITNLAKDKLVKHVPYKGVTLTEEGIRQGRRITRKHRILERFLSDILNVKKEETHDQACKIEHILSDDVEAEMCRILSNPKECPHGSEIPSCPKYPTGCKSCCKGNKVPLSSLKKGESAILELVLADSTTQAKLNSMGIIPGTEIVVVRKIKNGPVCFRACGTEIAVDAEVAKHILVKKREGN